MRKTDRHYKMWPHYLMDSLLYRLFCNGYEQKRLASDRDAVRKKKLFMAICHEKLFYEPIQKCPDMI